MNTSRRIILKYNLDVEFYKNTLKKEISKLQMGNLFEIILYSEIIMIDTQTGAILIQKVDVLNFITQLFDVVKNSLEDEKHKSVIDNEYQDYVFGTKVEDGYLLLENLNSTSKFKLKKLYSSLLEFKEQILKDIPLLYPEILASNHWKRIVSILNEK